MRFFLVSVLFLCLPIHETLALFVRVPGIEDSRITRVAISPFDRTRIYASSENSLFKSTDLGNTFTKTAVFTVEETVSLFFDDLSADAAYLATNKHLYRLAQSPEKLFTCPDEAGIVSATKSAGYFYVGTTRGLYRAQEDLLKFQKVDGFEGQTVFSIAPAGANIYIAASRGVFIYDTKNNRLTRVLVMREQETAGEEASGILPLVIAIDIFDANTLWLGTSKGMFCSQDKGANWQKFHVEALDAAAIRSCAQTSLETDALYVAGDKGIFRISIARRLAKSIFEGLSTSEISCIVFTDKGTLFAAASDGLFRNDYFTAPGALTAAVEVRGEPGILEVQLAALRYNETHPDKIRKWRSALKTRALFPTVSWSYDRTIYGSSSGQFATGPRDWGLTFAWDIGNLVWNTYEDDIDTRSRLNTELRIDILGDINRVYFERLRLKHELATSSLSEQELFQKNLRLQELTAILDGYTGGGFSRTLNEVSVK